jgi:hypothetical protein
VFILISRTGQLFARSNWSGGVGCCVSRKQYAVFFVLSKFWDELVIHGAANLPVKKSMKIDIDFGGMCSGLCILIKKAGETASVFSHADFYSSNVRLSEKI